MSVLDLQIKVLPLEPFHVHASMSNRSLAITTPASNSKLLFELLVPFDPGSLRVKFPILHQLLIGKQLKYLHHEQVL